MSERFEACVHVGHRVKQKTTKENGNPAAGATYLTGETKAKAIKQEAKCSVSTLLTVVLAALLE